MFCFKGWMGTGACPQFLLCLTNVFVFVEDPKSHEFLVHHCSGLGTQTVRQTYGYSKGKG